MPSKKPKKEESLGYLFPQIAKEWHPTKNGNLTPFDFTKGNKTKVWWKCPKGDDHEYLANINNRTQGSNCPICRGLKVVKSNSFATTNPEIAKEWHPTKNGNLLPTQYTSGSKAKVWWKCPKGPDHEWEAIIGSRVGGTNCPYCSGNLVSSSNCLATTHPEMAKEWHPTKNGTLTPLKVSFGSKVKVWWKCSKGDDHVWKTSVNAKAGCPICSGYKVVLSNCLATAHPKLAKQWHPTKNGTLTPFDVKNSSKKVWWKCDKGNDHEWNARINNRINHNAGCPICSGYKVVLSNCLATTNPKLAKQWHPIKNGTLTPYDVGSSMKKVWWKCSKGDDHEWKASLDSRIKGIGCPICSNRKVVLSNCLAITHPKLAKQWHPTNNGKLTPNDIVAGANKKVWWKCSKDKNHFWFTRVADRTISKSNCPYCDLTPQSREELIITHELITIFKGINPKGFKTRIKGKLRSIDIYIPDLKLGIEFDGSYWHKDKRALDKLKTEELEAEGFNIIRVRQKPLKRIFEDDVMAEKKYDGKKITNDILTQIMKDYKLGQSTILKINKYIEKPNLQNEKGLEKYIDMILTEKAEKK